MQITFELGKLVTYFWKHRVPDVKTRRNIYILALKGQCQNLTSGQGHVRSCVKPSRSCCISVDASVREKHIGTIPSALPLFYQKLEAKNECDLMYLEWPEGEVIGSIPTWAKNDGGSLEMIFLRAFERYFLFLATTPRSQVRGGASRRPPPADDGNFGAQARPGLTGDPMGSGAKRLPSIFFP